MIAKRRSFVNNAPGTLFKTLNFLRNLGMAGGVILHYIGKACKGQTLQLIETIRKLR
jgi:hypothetical protein